MTEQELIRRLEQERPPLPEGFAARHDGLLRRLTVQERKVSMKRIMAVALVALMLLGSVAYAATHIDLGALWNQRGLLTQEQTAYVNAAAQTPEITSVRMGGASREDYRLESLASLPAAGAYIDNITALAENGVLVIGFTPSAAGQGKQFTIGSVFVEDMPCVAFQREDTQGDQPIRWLYANLPSEITGGALRITLPLALTGEADAYQFISFTLGATDATPIAPVELVFSDHFAISLGAGSLSPLGLCIPLEIHNDQQVIQAGWCTVTLDGEEERMAATSIHFENLPDNTLEHTLEIIAEWVEVGEETDIHHRGRAVLRLDAMEEAEVFHGTIPVRWPEATTPELPYDGQPRNADVTPLRMTFRAREMTLEEVMALAEDVLGDTSGMIREESDDSAVSVGIWWYETEEDLAAGWPTFRASYVPYGAYLSITGRDRDNCFADRQDTVAPGCRWTAQEAADMALAWVTEKLNIPAGQMEVVEAIPLRSSAGGGGYLVTLNQLDEGMPRLLRSNGYKWRFTREWEILVKDRGICHCSGTLWELVGTEEVPDALTAQQAQDILEAAWADGSLGLPADAWITDIRAVSMKEETTMYGECVRVPVWDFHLADGAGHVWQLCVDRATGEIITMNRAGLVLN